MSLAGMGFDSKDSFTPPAVLLGLLLCPWMWGISSKSLQRCAATAPVPQDWENRLLEGTKKKHVCTRTQEKGSVTPQETGPDLPVSDQESPVEAWVGNGLLQGWGHRVHQCMLGTF